MSDKPVDQISNHEAPLKDGATSFGSFYPKNYVLAVFNTDAEGAHAAGKLREAGFANDDVIVASGEEIVQHGRTIKSEQSLFAKLGEQWSRLYTDESADTNTLMDFAKRGASFVLAYAPEEAQTATAEGILTALHPPVLRKYGNLAITELG